MKVLILVSSLLLVSVLVSGQAANDAKTINPANCGTKSVAKEDNDNVDPFKIVGGTASANGAWPWQVAMYYNNGFTCGGSVLNSEWIITAAHCIYGRNYATFFSFDIGVTDRSKPNVDSVLKRKVSKIVLHPQYNDRTSTNDIALMKLASPLTYSQNVVAACIPSTPATPGATVYVTGWGTTSAGGAVQTQLREVTQTLGSDAKCVAEWRFTAASQICAGLVNGGKDTCQGDSGGPLVAQRNGKWQLEGLTSYGYQKCGDGGVYTRVSFYDSWIRQIVANN
jgi:serine protease 7 (enterokinase)